MKFISSKRARKASLVCFAAATSLLGSAAHGATIYSWAAAGTGSWNDATQWVPNTGSPLAGDAAIFNAAGANGTDMIYLNGSQAADTITVNNTGATTIVGGNVATASSTQTLTLTTGLTVNSGAGAVQTGTTSSNNVLLQAASNISITNNSGNLLTIGGATASTALRGNGTAGTDIVTLGGSGNGLLAGVIQNNTTTIAITKNDAGNWELDGNSSFTGNVILNAGELNLKSLNALGSVTTKTLTINGGSIGAVSAARVLPAYLTNVAGDFTIGDTGNTSGLTFGGSINLGSSVHQITTFANGSFGAAVTGVGGGITKLGSTGTLEFLASSGASGYSGATTISAGTIAANTGNAFSQNSAVSIASAGNLNMAGFSQVIPSLSDSGGSGGHVFVGNAAAGVLTTGGDNSTTIFSGIIGGTGTGGGLTKTGSGMMTLKGANTYLGTTTVNGGGTLALNKTGGGALASTSAIALSGGAVLLDASNQINDAATVSFGGGTLNTGGNSETVGAGTLTASSVIDMGSGSSVLAFANSSASTWTGSTNLDIYDWSGTPVTGGGTDQLFFGTDATGLTSGQLAEIRFFSDAGITQYGGPTTILSNGEVVPGAVPEPTSLSLLLVGAGLLSRRRKSR